MSLALVPIRRRNVKFVSFLPLSLFLFSFCLFCFIDKSDHHAHGVLFSLFTEDDVSSFFSLIVSDTVCCLFPLLFFSFLPLSLFQCPSAHWLMPSDDFIESPFCCSLLFFFSFFIIRGRQLSFPSTCAWSLQYVHVQARQLACTCLSLKDGLLFQESYVDVPLSACLGLTFLP